VLKVLVGLASLLGVLLAEGLIPEEYVDTVVALLAVLGALGVYEAPNKPGDKDQPVDPAKVAVPLVGTAGIGGLIAATEFLDAPDWVWLALMGAAGVVFAALEIPAVMDKKPGGTLSETLRKVLRTHTQRGKVVWVTCWGVFAAWFLVHIGWVGTV
jgi:hypothetical protein